jgi:hypothetical protein
MFCLIKGLPVCGYNPQHTVAFGACLFPKGTSGHLNSHLHSRSCSSPQLWPSETSAGDWWINIMPWDNTPDKALPWGRIIDALKFSWWVQAWWLMPVIPVTQEAEIRRIAVWGQPQTKKKKKKWDSPSQLINQGWWPTSVVSAMRETKIGGSWSKTGPRPKHETLYKKITKAKNQNCVIQVVECLPSKCEALNSKFKPQHCQKQFFFLLFKLEF